MKPSLTPFGGSLAMAVLAIAIPASSAAAASGSDELSHRLDALASRDLRSAGPVERAHAISLATRGPGSLMTDRGRPVVDIRVRGDVGDRLAGLREAGAEIIATSPEDRLVSAAIDEADLRAVADAPGVEAVTEVLTPMTGAVEGAGSGAIDTCPTGTISEGNAQLKAGAARTQFDVDGTGVKVGVLSDSFNTGTMATKQANDVSSADLPGPGNPCGRAAPVQVVQDAATPEADEGRAMAQIVHDIAPGANLAFATAYPTDVAFANNIRALAAAGADVIVDDIIYFNEPVYQDGIIANAVRDVTADGVAYFSMAFNNNGLGINSYEAPAYRSTTCPAVVAAEPGADDCMDFDPGAGTDDMFDIDVTSGPNMRLGLNWAEPQSGITTDFNLYLLNNSGTTISFKGQADNLTTQQAFEFAAGSIGSTGARQIVIQRATGTGTPAVKFVSNDNGSDRITSTQPVVAPDVQGPTIYGHNGTAVAETVGAVPYYDGSTVEPFSSRGPVVHLFGPVNGLAPAPALATPEILAKPDIAATDGVLNTFFGSGNRFYGTSAAAPHAAGVAALQLEANPGLSQAEVKAAQEATADPVGAFGPLAAGAGLIDAPAAIGSAPPPAPTFNFGAVPARTKDRTPTVSITTSGDLKSETCRVDGQPARACGATFKASSLSDGKHRLTGTATDYFGRTGADSVSFKVDTKGPKVKIRKGPKATTTKTKAKFKFKTERGAKVRCKLDRGKYSKCSSAAVFEVKPGRHKLLIQATDALGNKGRAAGYAWKVKR
jgi:hypothetical protein